MSQEIKKKINIKFLLDESGSMANMGREPVDGMNNFYEEQKKAGEFISTLAFFNEELKYVHKNKVGSEVERVTYSDFYPRRMTSLYDAIGQMIEDQKEGDSKDSQTIFIILTDGQENNSKKYNSEDIKKLITQMETEYGWKFVYLGANQDSFTSAQNIGINTSHDYDYTQEGYSGLMRQVSVGVSRCVSGASEIVEIDLPSSIRQSENMSSNIVMDNNSLNFNTLSPSYSISDQYEFVLPPVSFSRTFNG